MYFPQYIKKKKLLSWRFNKKKSGGGLVITQTSHLIYFLTYLFGETSQVKSYLKNMFSQNNMEDYAHIILAYKKNICASIDASWSGKLLVFHDKKFHIPRPFQTLQSKAH